MEKRRYKAQMKKNRLRITEGGADTSKVAFYSDPDDYILLWALLCYQFIKASLCIWWKFVEPVEVLARLLVASSTIFKAFLSTAPSDFAG